MQETIRVGAAQLRVGADLDENLLACVQMIDRAADACLDLLVLPEFCNHLSWYEDDAHCAAVAVAVDGPWLGAIAARAAHHALHVVVNATVRRDDGRVTGTSLLYADDGRLLARADKQVLMGHENRFLQRATTQSPVVETRLGRLGLYACMDGVVMETPRGLAVRGAQILCNSLNSFARDEGALHIPVRAPENRVFVVAANKVGPLLPEALLGPVSSATSIPERFLHGSGESQVIAPDGTVLCRASPTAEELVWADINLRVADDKRSACGTDVLASRRPALYRSIAAPSSATATTTTGAAAPASAAAAVTAAVFVPRSGGAAGIDALVACIAGLAGAGPALLVLPELFFIDARHPGGAPLVTDVDAAIAAGARALQAIAAATKGTGVAVCFTTLERDGRSAGGGDDVDRRRAAAPVAAGALRHRALLVADGEVCGRQDQLHESARRPGLALGDAMAAFDLPWGRVAMVVGRDALYPETFRLAALAGAATVAVSTHVEETWEVETGLLERAAENRVCLVAATRPSPVGASLICTLHEDFTLMTPWKTRAFDGDISAPRVTRAARSPGVLRATIHPAHASNKLVSEGTDVLHGRAHQLASALADDAWADAAALRENALPERPGT